MYLEFLFHFRTLCGDGSIDVGGVVEVVTCGLRNNAWSEGGGVDNIVALELLQFGLTRRNW